LFEEPRMMILMIGQRDDGASILPFFHSSIEICFDGWEERIPQWLKPPSTMV
jgi:hypothetical protein